MSSIFQKRLELFFRRNHERVNYTELTICLGNEGMDLDSFISSLVVAFACDLVHVVNMRKDVFLAKGELMLLCKMFGIDTDNLIYLERPADAGIGSAAAGTYLRIGDTILPIRDKHLRLVLTDHNSVVSELAGTDVAMVIDHHVLETPVRTARTIYIDTDVGSATTLVARYLGDDLSRKHHCVVDPKNTDPDKITLCEAIARLLLVPIIMDTSHLRRRTSIFDQYEYSRLKRQAHIKKKELKQMRKSLRIARLNDQDCKTDIILQKDFKKYTHNDISFGISSVKYAYEDWVDREAKTVTGIPEDKHGIILWMQLEDFRSRFGLDFFLVNCKLNKQRHYIIVNFPLIDLFAQENGFEKRNFKGIDFFRAKTDQSRKLITPKIHSFISKIILKK